MTDMTQLYRHFDENNELLYVGISLSTVYRLSQHKVASPWFADIKKVEIETFPSREEALEAEREAIQTEDPKYNIVHKKHENLAEFISETEDQGKEKPRLLRRVVEFKPMYTTAEAAKELGLSEHTVRRLMNEGRIGYVRPDGFDGRRRYITGWQIIDYLEHLEAITPEIEGDLAKKLD